MDLSIPNAAEDGIRYLTNVTFRLWRLTPLLDFDKKTRDQLEASLTKHMLGVFSLVTGPVIVAVSIYHFNVQEWDRVDPKCWPLRIEVVIQERESSLQTNVMLLMPATFNFKTELAGNAKDYPLALMRFGTRAAETPMLEWLRDTFTCSAIPYCPSRVMLNTLLEWWTDQLLTLPANEREFNMPFRCGVDLDFEGPNDHIDTISTFISFKNLVKLKDVGGKNASILEIIRLHIKQTLGIDIKQLVCTRVGTPVAYLSNQGQIKLLPRISRELHLSLLTEISDLSSLAM
ncbi:hypothetical protein BC940DRAFT_297477 [Gongronella butleri]|nr:hypothetical protein BC940DRAFT_297477 [Gongronella butleri]